MSCSVIYHQECDPHKRKGRWWLSYQSDEVSISPFVHVAVQCKLRTRASTLLQVLENSILKSVCRLAWGRFHGRCANCEVWPCCFILWDCPRKIILQRRSGASAPTPLVKPRLHNQKDWRQADLHYWFVWIIPNYSTIPHLTLHELHWVITGRLLV